MSTKSINLSKATKDYLQDEAFAMFRELPKENQLISYGFIKGLWKEKAKEDLMLKVNTAPKLKVMSSRFGREVNNY